MHHVDFPWLAPDHHHEPTETFLHADNKQMESILKQLRTGYIPSQSETEGIHTDLVSLWEEFGRLDTLIEDLTAQRDKVIETIEFKQALISPVRRLPHDIVEEIFLACLPSHRNAVMSVREAPLILCRVCNIWRAVALASPRIWASLHVPVGFLLLDDETLLVAMQWLKRSAACPLSLSICGAGTWPGHITALGQENPDDTLNATDRIVQSLVESAPRWRDVGLSNLSQSSLQHLRTTPLPLLETIRIRSQQPVTEWLDVIMSPGVRTVHLDGMVSEEDSSILLHRLAHITHLTISGSPLPGIPGTVAVSILTTLTQLVSLKLAVMGVLSMDGTTHLPVLEFLELRLRSSDDLPLVTNQLDHLLMPQLRHFAVESATEAESTAPVFATLGERSPLIESLEISLHNFTRDGLRGTLLNFPSLVDLVVHNTVPMSWHPDHTILFASTEYLLSLLTEEAQLLLPSLRSLESKYGMGVSDKTLFDFLQSRVDAGAIGFRFKLEQLRSQQPPDVEQFRSRGVYVTFTPMNPDWIPPSFDPWSGLPASESELSI